MFEQEVPALSDLSGAYLHGPSDVVLRTLELTSYHGRIAPLDVERLDLAEGRAHGGTDDHKGLRVLDELHDLVPHLAVAEVPWRRSLRVVCRQV